MRKSNLKLAEKNATHEEALTKAKEEFHEWWQEQEQESNIPELYKNCGVWSCADQAFKPLKVLAGILVEKIQEAEGFMGRVHDFIDTYEKHRRILSHRRGEVVLKRRFPNLSNEEVRKIISEVFMGGFE